MHFRAGRLPDSPRANGNGRSTNKRSLPLPLGVLDFLSLPGRQPFLTSHKSEHLPSEVPYACF